MEEKKALQVAPVKRPIGQPPRAPEAIPLQPTMEGQPFKTRKVRSSYTNWFEPCLWSPIYAVVRQ
jgi:hypothetical protein